MIIKNATFGKTENVTILEMGTGDVLMIGSKKGVDGEVVLALKTTEPKEIDVKLKTGFSSYDEMQPELVFIFNKAKSLNALIGVLNDCLAEMLS
ncbi:MAG: hypothetical protein EOM05_10770 [Clostridia bacterium]|nr:hypothetical protein [Clostridia bacterium]